MPARRATVSVGIATLAPNFRARARTGVTTSVTYPGGARTCAAPGFVLYDGMPAPQTPLLTVDIIIELIDRPGRPVVLIERKHEPLGWALPGGFVDIGEAIEEAAVREAAEETNLKIELKALLGVYSDPRRDPRGHTASAVYVASATGDPTAMDDAAAIKAYDVSELPTQLAFDHAEILADYRVFRETGKTPPPHVVGPSTPAA